LKILVFGQFEDTLLVVKILKQHPLVCGVSNELSTLTALSMGWTSSSIAKVGSSFGKTATPEEIRP
jgi:hypothetical protein